MRGRLAWIVAVCITLALVAIGMALNEAWPSSGWLFILLPPFCLGQLVAEACSRR
jgi:hypothetical protein